MLAQPSASDANRRRGGEGLAALAGGPEPWSVVRQVHTQGSHYLETHVAPFGPYPMHAHAAPGIALLLRGAVEVTYASGDRIAGDARERVGALVLPVGTPHAGRAGADGARVLMLALEGLTVELLSALVRPGQESARPGPPPAWLRRVRAALDERYHERALRIGDLAQVAGVDPAYLARALRAHYGTAAGVGVQVVETVPWLWHLTKSRSAALSVVPAPYLVPG